jgi:hypothetical protein
MLEVRQLHAGHFGQVGDAFHGGQAGAAFAKSGRKHFGQQLDAGMRGDARRRQQARFAQRPATQQQGALAPGADGLRDAATTSSWLATQVSGDAARRLATVAPGHVRGQDQRGHLAGQTARSQHRIDGVLAQLGVVREVRTKPGETLRATVSMSDCSCASYCVCVGGVVADDVDHRHLALARVVQVGESVAEAAAQVQQGGGGACRPCARSRRPRRWQRPRTGPAPRACAVRCRVRRRSAFRWFRDW